MRRLMREMFPAEKYTDEQVQEGFSLIDLQGTGKIRFSVFRDWWANMKVSDKMGLRQQWKRRLFDEECKAASELEGRALRWRRKNCWRRWKSRALLCVYYARIQKEIFQRHRRLVLTHVLKQWVVQQLGPTNDGPQYGKSIGARIQEANSNVIRRKWGKGDSSSMIWEGGAEIVPAKRGISQKADSPGGRITRSHRLVTPPANFAMRSPRKIHPEHPPLFIVPAASPRSPSLLKAPRHEMGNTWSRNPVNSSMSLSIPTGGVSSSFSSSSPPPSARPVHPQQTI